jgi:hypothetical protein
MNWEQRVSENGAGFGLREDTPLNFFFSKSIIFVYNERLEPVERMLNISLCVTGMSTERVEYVYHV